MNVYVYTYLWKRVALYAPGIIIIGIIIRLVHDIPFIEKIIQMCEVLTQVVITEGDSAVLF